VWLRWHEYAYARGAGGVALIQQRGGGWVGCRPLTAGELRAAFTLQPGRCTLDEEALGPLAVRAAAPCCQGGWVLGAGCYRPEENLAV
jgi:hypothetical protein